MCLLLAAPIYFIKGWQASKILHTVFAFILTKLATGQETALPLAADSMLSQLSKQDTEESDCQTLPRQASLLTCGICRASGQIFISPDSLTGVECYRTILTLENVPEDVLEYNWYRNMDSSTENMVFSYINLPIPDSLDPCTLVYLQHAPKLKKVDLILYLFLLPHLELGSNPGISVNASANASVLVEGMDSVVARCLTNSSNIKWVSHYDRNLQCAIEDFPEILQRSEEIPLNVAYGPDYVSLWTLPDVFNGVLTAVTGSSVQLECTCFSRPEPKYHWIHNGSLLSVSEENMTLPSLSWEQMGSYRCIVENLETQLAFYREVTIQPPQYCDNPNTIENCPKADQPACTSQRKPELMTLCNHTSSLITFILRTRQHLVSLSLCGSCAPLTMVTAIQVTGVYAHTVQYPQSPEEGICSPGTGIQGGCDLRDVGSGN
ncbi:hypothetical protein STEG23_026319 [Scotinomys teguina]